MNKEIDADLFNFILMKLNKKFNGKSFYPQDIMYEYNRVARIKGLPKINRKEVEILWQKK